MTAIMFDSAWDRAKRWMLRGGLTFGAGLALWVSSMLGSTLFGPVIEAARPGATLLTQKVIDTFGGRWVVGTIALLLLLFSQWLRGRRLQLRQKDYDSTGQKILTTLRSDPAARVPDFYLYLRAFETTGKLHVPLYLRVRRKCVWVGQRQVTDDLESYVTLAVGGRAPLIALGKPGEAIGAGRILTEEEHWQAQSEFARVRSAPSPPVPGPCARDESDRKSRPAARYSYWIAHSFGLQGLRATPRFSFSSLRFKILKTFSATFAKGTAQGAKKFPRTPLLDPAYRLPGRQESPGQLPFGPPPHALT